MTVIDQPAAIVEFTRFYLALFYTGVALFYSCKIIITQKKTAGNLVFAGPRYCSTWWNHTAFRLFRMIIWLVCTLRLFFPAIDNGLGLLPALTEFSVILCGNILLTVGFVSTLVLHFSMADAWRSGIDPAGPRQLITTGAFRFSRNPIFVAVGISQLGFFLALPSMFTLICLLVGLAALYRQTLAEERHLACVFPRQYPAYVASTRRWL